MGRWDTIWMTTGSHGHCKRKTPTTAVSSTRPRFPSSSTLCRFPSPFKTLCFHIVPSLFISLSQDCRHPVLILEWLPWSNFFVLLYTTRLLPSRWWNPAVSLLANVRFLRTSALSLTLSLSRFFFHRLLPSFGFHRIQERTIARPETKVPHLTLSRLFWVLSYMPSGQPQTHHHPPCSRQPNTSRPRMPRR
jgi:hypothetical protein